MYTIVIRSFRLVALTGGLLALSSCGDPERPVVAGPPFFTTTIDGTPSVPGTASCIVLSSTGTATLIAASRLVSAQEEQDISIAFPDFPAQGQFALGDILGGGATAFFAVYPVNGAIRGFPLLYSSRTAQPGLLSITGVNLTDTLMTGTFTFDAATTPDTTTHHLVTGNFRLHCERAGLP